MAKLLIIVAVVGALAGGFAAPKPKPPLLIDSHPAPAPIAPLDAAN